MSRIETIISFLFENTSLLIVSVILSSLYNKKRDFSYSFTNILDENDKYFFYYDIYYVNSLLIITSIVINIDETVRLILANRS